MSEKVKIKPRPAVYGQGKPNLKANHNDNGALTAAYMLGVEKGKRTAQVGGCNNCSHCAGMQNDMWGCTVMCHVRGKTKKHYGDCDYFSENKPEIMKDAAELKPCPCCGNAVQHIDNDSPMSILFAVECPSCQLRTAWFRTKEGG